MSKLNIVSKLALPILLLVLLLGLGAGLVLAGRGDNAESGYERPTDKPASGGAEEALQTGSGQQSGDLQVNGEGQLETAVSPFTTEELELLSEANTPQAESFKRVAGSNFQPRDSTATYSYGGGGCIRRDSNVGDSWFTVDLQLPEGAMIDELTVYYYDNSNIYDINSELWAFDGAGGTMLLAEADSAGALGYTSTASNVISHTVDNLNESLVIVASIQGGIGSDLQLCGIQVRYQYNPFSASFLPAVLNTSEP